MQKKKLKTFRLTIMAFALSLFAVQAQQVVDVMSVYPATGGTPAVYILDNIQKLLFTTGELSVKPIDNSATLYAFGNVSKVTFSKTSGVPNSLTTIGADVSVNWPEPGVLAVQSCAALKSLTLLSIDGKILQKTTSSTMFVGSLPASVYLLQIETAQAKVVKKIIKQ